MNKTLMVLGAGYGQLPAIIKAKERGYRVIATSNNHCDVGMSIADIPLVIDTTNVESTLEAAIINKVDGILTMSTDVALPSVGKVADELGLVGPSFQATLFSTNKVLMKKRMLERNIPTAKAVFVNTIDEASERIKALKLPVMVKTASSSGSRGITKIDHVTQLEEAFKYARSIPKSDIIIIEEFIDGFEFGAQGLVYKGEMKFVFPHNDTVTPFPYLVPIGHSYPMELSNKKRKELFDIVVECVKVLEIDNSFLNVDLIMTSSGPKIIEIGARMGATCLPELTTIFTGIDVVDVAIEMAMGHKLNLKENNKKQPCAGLLIRSAKTGILEMADTPDELINEPNLIAIRWDKKKGDNVRKFEVGPDRIGEIVVISDSWHGAERLCKKIESSLFIKVKDH